jgi:hypothetical protein
MKQFIKAKAEGGEERYINLNLVSIIHKTDSGYALNLFGNKFTVDTVDGKEAIHCLLSRDNSVKDENPQS